MYSFYLFQVSIPERKTKTKDPNKAPEFVYNVMGTYIFFLLSQSYIYDQAILFIPLNVL